MDFENKYVKYKNKYLKLKNELGFTLTSSAFENGDVIPIKYTCDGEDIMPDLSWTNPPLNTQSFALIIEDPQAPQGTWDHLVVWNIDKNINNITHNDLFKYPIGKNSWGKNKYGGPCPPKKHGDHLYIFKLYALDKILNITNENKQNLLKAMMGHILAEARIVGLFGRK